MAKKKKGGRTTPKKAHKRRVRLAVIPEPEPNTRSVLVYTGEGTVVMRGPGSVTMECGNCGSPLVVGISVSRIINMVLRCNNCGEYNEVLA